MQYIKRYILLLIICIFQMGGVFANTNKNVLIISSYGTDYQWANSIIDGINTAVKACCPTTDLHAEYLTSERFTNSKQWTEKMDTLLNRYKNNIPQAIVLISDEAWMAYRAADNAPFKDIPLLLCAIKPHSISIDSYHDNNLTLSIDDFSKTADVMQVYNATGVLREMNISGYIDLMKQAIPNLNKFTLITDNRFYGIYTRLLFEQAIRAHYSDFPTDYIDARFVNTDTLLHKLPQITNNTGVLLTSWLTGEHGFTYSKNYVYKEMTANIKPPIFITNDIGLDKGWFIGGYFNNAGFWGEKIGSMLVDILKKGVSVSEIPPLTFREEQCNVNYEVLKKFQLTKRNFPKETVYINSPTSLFERYKAEITFIFAIFILVIVSAIYMLNSNIKLKKAQRQILQSIKETDAVNQELLKTKASLTEALEKAKAADALKSSFVANMGNQIKDPLNAIVGFSNLISVMDNAEEREETASMIKQSSNTLFKLITSILDVSQLESKSITFYNEDINLNALCEDLINSQKSLCTPETTILFKSPKEPLSINSDPQRLAQVLIILLDNAIRFTTKGTIEIGYYPYGDEEIEFYVQDTGIGIASYNLDIIFDSFVKIDQYTAGAGLGLTIAKNIIEIFGGEIGVTSSFGKGSRFWFRIKTA